MIRIYLTNLGKYNEGELVGRWVELPCSDFEEILKEIGIDGEEYEEYFITDYETDIGLKIDEYDNLDELNDIAEETDGLGNSELIILQAILESYSNNFKEALEVFKSGDYMVFFDVKNNYDLGYEYMEMTDGLSEMPEHLKSYFDYESYGRDLSYDGFHIIESLEVAIAIH